MSFSENGHFVERRFPTLDAEGVAWFAFTTPLYDVHPSLSVWRPLKSQDDDIPREIRTREDEFTFVSSQMDDLEGDGFHFVDDRQRTNRSSFNQNGVVTASHRSRAVGVSV